MTVELRPCPFCGGEASLREVPGDTYGPGYWVALCLGCGIQTARPFTHEKDTRQRVADAWNTRDPTRR